MPMRKILINYRNVAGIAAHTKADGQAMFEAGLERDFIALLEFYPTVKTFEVKLLTLDWTDSVYIEIFYNRQRRHSRLGYLAPAVFAQKYSEQQA